MSYITLPSVFEDEVKSTKTKDHRSEYFSNLEDAKKCVMIENLKGRHTIIIDNKIKEETK